MKHGCHRAVRPKSGQRPSRKRELVKDKFKDEEGNLFHQYPIYDDPELAAPLPAICIARVTQEAMNGGNGQQGRRQRHSPNSGRTKCGECGHVRHNRRTFPTRRAPVGQPKVAHGAIVKPTEVKL